MTSTPWLDLENADQRSWALIYLRTHRGAVITEKGLDEWLIQERRKDSAVLARMKRAWGQVQRRKESRRESMQLRTFIQGKASPGFAGKAERIKH